MTGNIYLWLDNLRAFADQVKKWRLKDIAVGLQLARYVKSCHNCFCKSTDFDEIWHGDANTPPIDR